MKTTVLGYENGYLVNGIFQSSCPMSALIEYTPVKVRVSVEGSRVVRDYKRPQDRNYTRVTEEGQR